MPWQWWEHLCTTDFATLDAARAVALLPLAAIEQHGPHLPLGTDALICDAIVDEALANLHNDVFVLRLPTQRVGLSPEHASFTGTLTLAPDTMISAWRQLGRAVARAGLNKVILFNSHGGQTQVVDIVAQALRREAGILAVRASYFRFRLPAQIDDAIPERERRYGLHGGQIETSLMLAIAPDLVRMENALDFPSTAREVDARYRVLAVEGETGMGWLAEDLNAYGVTGDAGAATAAVGRQLLKHYGAKLTALIADVQDISWPPHGG